MGPGHQDAKRLLIVLHLQYINLQTFIDPYPFTLHLLIFIQDTISLAQVDHDIVFIDPLHNTSDDFLLLGMIILVDIILFFLTQILQKHILGILCRNT